jgi:hypothetical protein
MHLLNMFSHFFIYLDFLNCQAISSFRGRLTSQEPLGFSRLCIPILFKGYNPHQYADYEDYPSVKFFLR